MVDVANASILLTRNLLKLYLPHEFFSAFIPPLFKKIENKNYL